MSVDWPMASAFAGPQASPGFVFWRDFLIWQRGLNEALRPLGLTQPQFALLATIGWLTREDESEVCLTQQALADFTGLDRMHVSQIASRLEATGLIARSASTTDRRAKGLTLTPLGGTRLTAALPIVEAHDAFFFVEKGGGTKG
jgi:DNA-binding MarR family transcriptional regulator